MTNKGLIFGTFDGFHLGHQYFIEQALEIVDDLIVSLASDKYIELYKDRKPRNTFNERKEYLHQLYPQLKISESDNELGEYSIIKQEKPDIVILGYDQNELRDNLINWIQKNKLKIEVIETDDFNADKFKSSKLYD